MAVKSKNHVTPSRTPNICPWESDSEHLFAVITNFIVTVGVLFLIYVMCGLISIMAVPGAGYAVIPGALVALVVIRRRKKTGADRAREKAYARADGNIYNLVDKAICKGGNTQDQARTLLYSAANSISAYFDDPDLFRGTASPTTHMRVAMYFGLFAAIARTVLGYSSVAVADYANAAGHALTKMYNAPFGDKAVTAIKDIYLESMTYPKNRKAKDSHEASLILCDILDGFLGAHSELRTEAFYNTVSRFLYSIPTHSDNTVLPEQYAICPPDKYIVDLTPVPTSDVRQAPVAPSPAVPEPIIHADNARVADAEDPNEEAERSKSEPPETVEAADAAEDTPPVASQKNKKGNIEDRVLAIIVVAAICVTVSAFVIEGIVDSLTSADRGDAGTLVEYIEESGVSKKETREIINSVKSAEGAAKKLECLNEFELDSDAKCMIYAQLIAAPDRQGVCFEIIDGDYDSSDRVYDFLTTVDLNLDNCRTKTDKVALLRSAPGGKAMEELYFLRCIADEPAAETLALLEQSGASLNEGYLYVVEEVFCADLEYKKIDVLCQSPHISDDYKKIIYTTQIADSDEAEAFYAVVDRLKDEGGTVDDYLAAKQAVTGISSRSGRYKAIRSAVSGGRYVLNILYDAFDAAKDDYSEGYSKGYAAGKRKSKKDDLGLGLDLPDLSFSIFD